MPPLFVLAGVGFEQLNIKLKKFVWSAILIIVVLFPNIFAIASLHPYEYIYFNRLAGGVSGAYRNYELDYWLLSYREAIEYLNENAVPGATVSVQNGYSLVAWVARGDLRLTGPIREFPPENVKYVVVSTNLALDKELEGALPNMIEIYAVVREGVPLTKVYQIVE